ncbi:DUF2239 family protein [Pararhodobacter zhoushanensis]|uniref:DUF2239 family protein n=1 Tax=Pararhodobacter zhoushanensis TaxID=2479545 RepID=A0ABT3GY75_9RHOB|nr:DUF2239 family protein [Pararhodobacter zhoushanensis]MCW1932415.1 DUF2239 family protein [Pararhodobacter zhoushanensis]
MTDVTAFRGPDRIAHGPLTQVAPVALAQGALEGAVLVLDDATGRIVDLDPRDWDGTPLTPRRGRPKLGVIPREVTLLQTDWDWLATQRGGASATLRRLVAAARTAEGGAAQRRDALYRAMQVLGGDRPGFEEATRALYAGDAAGVAAQIAAWPADLRTYLLERISAAGLG